MDEMSEGAPTPVEEFPVLDEPEEPEDPDPEEPDEPEPEPNGNEPELEPDEPEDPDEPDEPEPLLAAAVETGWLGQMACPSPTPPSTAANTTTPATAITPPVRFLDEGGAAGGA
jgi:hypothetical protein